MAETYGSKPQVTPEVEQSIEDPGTGGAEEAAAAPPGEGGPALTITGQGKLTVFTYLPDRLPLPNVLVIATSVDGGRVPLETKADGSDEVDTAEGSYAVSCAASGYDEAVRYVAVGDGPRRQVQAAEPIPVEEYQSTLLEIGFVPDNGTRAAVEELATFPVLTEEVEGVAPAPAAGGPAGGGSTRLVEGAIREALGWRPRPGDPRGFSAALASSFDRREVQGHTEAVWTPRSYATQIQADLGAITGAQASVYARARVALDAALPLLDGLYPLDPAADPQDTEAIRAIIRSELTELVAELGVEGGPRISRIDDLFDLLLHRSLSTGHGTTVNGQIALLQARFGLTERRVETVEEEENLTNALIFRAYVEEIEASWLANKRFFDPTSGVKPFLGTQLVLLSRSLSVVAESVTEVGYTLDSVFVGAAERQSIVVTFPKGGTGTHPLTDSAGKDVKVPPNTPPILLGDLLSWVERVATEEGPQLLQDGGKDGATALSPVLDRLRTLVRASLLTTGSGSSRGLQAPGSVPAGYATVRVQRALRELADYLDRAFREADQIKR